MRYKKISGLKGLLYGTLTAGTLMISSCDSSPVTSNPDPDPEPIPLFYQTAAIENFNEIKYAATLENVLQATLKVFRNDEPETLVSKTITGSNNSKINFQETFTYFDNDITKGRYTIILEDYNAKIKPDTVKIEIPNYPSEVDFNQLSLNFDEDSSITVSLPTITDKNPEDNPVLYADVEPTDGKTNSQLSLNRDELIIQGNENAVGDYQLNIGFETVTNEKYTQILEGTIYDLLDVSGFLEDTETKTRQEGIVKIYDENNSLLEEILVGSSGEFNKRINKRISDLTENILIQGRAINPETNQPISYIRTLNLPRGDIENKIIRVVPYTGLEEHDITPEDFYRHFAMVFTRDNDKPDTDPLIWNPMILKWGFNLNKDITTLNEIIISLQHWEGSDKGHFSQETAETIKERIFDKEDIGGWFNEEINDLNKIKIFNSQPDPFFKEEYYGKIIIFPEKNISGFASTYDLNGDGYIEIGRIRIGVDIQGNLGNQSTITHEMGHVSGLFGHAIQPWRLEPELTVMGRSSQPDLGKEPRFADKKTAKALYDNTVIHGEGTLENKRLGLRDLMWFYWLDENFSP